MSASMEITAGEHFLYGGRSVQVLEVVDQTVRLRTLDGVPTVMYRSLPTLRRAAGKGRLIKIQADPSISFSETVFPRLSEQQAAELKLRLEYVRSVLCSFHGKKRRP
jgi:hypothetical protein